MSDVLPSEISGVVDHMVDGWMGVRRPRATLPPVGVLERGLLDELAAYKGKTRRYVLELLIRKEHARVLRLFLKKQKDGTLRLPAKNSFE